MNARKCRYFLSFIFSENLGIPAAKEFKYHPLTPGSLFLPCFCLRPGAQVGQIRQQQRKRAPFSIRGLHFDSAAQLIGDGLADAQS